MKPRKRSRREWEALVAEWSASGLGRRAFADQHGVAPATLSWWRCRLRREAGAALLPVRVIDDPDSAREAADFRLDLASGRTLHVPAGFDESALRRLLAVLEGAPC